MTGIIYNNNSFIVNTGSTSIEYNSMGGGSVGYSMYGENIPEVPSGRYQKLSWIRLERNAYIKTTDKYNQNFDVKFCIKSLSTDYNSWNTIASAPLEQDYISHANGHICIYYKGSSGFYTYPYLMFGQQTGTSSGNFDITVNVYPYNKFLYFNYSKLTGLKMGETDYEGETQQLEKGISSVSEWNNNQLNIWLFNDYDNHKFQGYFKELIYLLNDNVALSYRPYLDTEENKVVIIEEVNSTVYEFLGTAPTVYE